MSDRLPHDRFGVGDVVQAIAVDKKQHTRANLEFPNQLPQEVTELLEKLDKACLAHELPYYYAFSMPGGILCRSDLGHYPQNLNIPFLMSRASAAGDQEHMMEVMQKGMPLMAQR